MAPPPEEEVLRRARTRYVPVAALISALDKRVARAHLLADCAVYVAFCAALGSQAVTFYDRSALQDFAGALYRLLLSYEFYAAGGSARWRCSPCSPSPTPWTPRSGGWWTTPAGATRPRL